MVTTHTLISPFHVRFWVAIIGIPRSSGFLLTPLPGNGEFRRSYDLKA